MLIYADDSQIFSSAKDCVELNANLNHDLNNVKFQNRAARIIAGASYMRSDLL